MTILGKFLGPKSTYDDSIPYLYEARVPVAELDDVSHSYFGDTICTLVGLLKENGIAPGETRIYEIFQGEETEIEARHCCSPTGEWLGKPELCAALDEHYKGHIQMGENGAFKGCDFDDREKRGEGPY